MSLADYSCVSCGARVWTNTRDAAARIRVIHKMCSACDADAAQDVRVAFGAVERRERARVAPVPHVEPLPAFLGRVLVACVVLALCAVIVAPFAVEAFVVGAICAGVFWFAQLVGRFLA